VQLRVLILYHLLRGIPDDHWWQDRQPGNARPVSFLRHGAGLYDCHTRPAAHRCGEFDNILNIT